MPLEESPTLDYRAPHASRFDDHPLSQVSNRHVSPLEKMCHLLVADGRLAADQRDGRRVVEDIHAILGVARHLAEQPFFAFHVFSIRPDAFKLTSDTLTRHPGLLSNEQLRDLAHELASPGNQTVLDYSGERMVFHDLIQRAYTDDGRGDGRITLAGAQLLADHGWNSPTFHPDHAGEKVALPGLLFLMASRRDMLTKFDHCMDQLESEARQPMRQALDSAIHQEVMGWPTLEMLRYYPVWQFVGSLSYPYRGRLTKEHNLAYLEGTTLGIALELYRRDHGAWPDKLEALTPSYIPTLPVDRITGDALHYRIVNDRPIVYSVGDDHDDDGGRMLTTASGFASNMAAACWPTNRRVPIPGNADAGHQREARDGDWIIWPIPDN